MLLLAGLATALPAAAQAVSRSFLLPTFIERVAPSELVPGAERFGEPEGTPPVVPALAGEEVVGYVYLTSDVVNTAGYSGKPIHTLVGLDSEGTIVGTKLVEHHEPIVLIGIPESRIEAYMDGLLGFNPLQAAARGESAPEVDIVSGATVTVLVIGDGVIRSAGRIAARLSGTTSEPVAGPQRVVDPDGGEVTDWLTLLGNGAVRRLEITVAEVNRAFERAGDARAAKRPEKGPPDRLFIDLSVALVSQPAIGRSLLGEAAWRRLEERLEPGQAALLVMGRGRYSFKGSGYVRGGIFDRIEVTQGSETIRFRDKQHERIGDLAPQAGAPDFKEIALFVVPEGTQFEPAETFTLQLLVQRPIGALEKAFTSFALDYRLPRPYAKSEAAADAGASEPSPAGAAATVTAPADALSVAGGLADGEAERPLWQRIWRSKLVSIGLLGAMLLALTGIFFFQDQLVKREKLFDRIRLGYLIVTLFWLGWVAQAQLSVVNVLAFANSLRADFQWSYFLVDPLIFILWFAVAASLLFWGRGPFCGWLCPFGALQELSNRVARRLKVPQVKVPWGLHERLWPIKYMVFLALFGISLTSLALAEQLAEVEPFKTAIVLRFVRDWWFVAFALVLIGAGLFIERFFCRYLCPLGAALAIPGRLRMFDWLKRYRECGSPCMRCYQECPVGAIHPEGHINPNECISCLHCQVLYHHDRKCPVVIQKRLKRERRAGGAAAPASGLPPRPRISDRSAAEPAEPASQPADH